MQQNNWSVPFQSVKVTKDKAERLSKTTKCTSNAKWDTGSDVKTEKGTSVGK